MNNTKKTGITLLTAEQAAGENALDVIKKYGSITDSADLALLQGMDAFRAADSTGYRKIRLLSPSYTSTVDPERGALYVTGNGTIDSLPVTISKTRYYSAGIRPVLPPSITKGLTPQNVQRLEDGFLVGEYGEYPQKRPNVNMDFFRCFTPNQIRAIDYDFDFTGKFYTFNQTRRAVSTRCLTTMPWVTEFSKKIYIPNRYPECQYLGDKYVCVCGDPICDHQNLGKISLSNGSVAVRGVIYWLKVSPIKWLIDEKTGIWVAKDNIISGIPLYATEAEYKEAESKHFEKSSMYRYLNTYFRYEMLPTEQYLEKVKSGEIKHSVPAMCYNDDYYSAKRITSHDIMEALNKRPGPQRITPYDIMKAVERAGPEVILPILNILRNEEDFKERED